MRTKKGAEMKPQPTTKLAEIIHMDVLRRNRERREAEARAATISAENRNLSQAW
jgi:hypothetical protein